MDVLKIAEDFRDEKNKKPPISIDENGGFLWSIRDSIIWQDLAVLLISRVLFALTHL